MDTNAIFINCPFDSRYLPLLRALLFVARFYGLKVNIASNDTDSKSNRLERIISLMKDSKYSIHDLSRFKSETGGEYYRMNMPFELGLDYGLCGSDKVFLIFEQEEFKLKRALSDISGWDVCPHNNNPEKMVQEFRKWIVVNKALPNEKKDLSASDVWYVFNDFYAHFSNFMTLHHMKDEEISVQEYLIRVDDFMNNYKIGE